ncbi:beta-glucosidase [Scheffersomyces stipitis CBS 6054]|uniref:beta-glucosidase n=1 Tax=Scheffersomyces stipitis (strain ATCC 58785 / CBS 6054 / NBRC 10063 / NRRL Y-11545) TaxID=322104 RepID=A3GFE6_PICST|nr:beta-glucosidase [Scheffersomyces stipitis CBS 6054]EAZ63743.1 beta-glucosidase [Scheffersomyces stipitis CBS 6054]
MGAQELDIEYLIKELTLPEKISLLAGKDFWHTFPIERLNIPSIRVSDGPNGIRGTKFFNSVPSNCFPCGTGLAATFNKDLWVEAGELMGKEAKMKGAHVILGPTSNIVRSPLGGRAFESYSEDPLLSGHAASNIIKGIQNENVVACLKHFVCNDQEDDRRGVDTLLTDRALREIYLKPFQIALRDSEPGALMTSYNKIRGIHVSESKELMQDILRDEYKYEGTTMSDWLGTNSTKAALDAGVNLEMPGPARFRTQLQVTHEIQSKRIHAQTIDDNVRGVLKLINRALKAGIPDDVVESANEDPASSELLRKVGDESIVLLKNEGNILPLSKTSVAGQEKIAVIGPNVKAAQDSGGGSASLTARYKVTPWEGIKKKIEEGGNTVSLEYSLGAFLDKNMPDVGDILENDKGEKGVTAKFYKTAPGTKDRQQFAERFLPTTKLCLFDFKDPELAPGEVLFYADFEGYFTPEETADYEFGASVMGTAQVFVDGKLVVDNKTKQTKGDAFFLAMGTREERGTVHLEKGKKYHVKCEFGTAPTYTLDPTQEIGGAFFGFRIDSPQETELTKAIELAKSVDKVILVVGLSKEWESEGFDRSDMDIPGATNQLIEEVLKVNKNVVIVNQSGSPVTMPWAEKVPALVHAWYGGNELGNTIADVLFGDVNPSGKLSMSFPKKLEDTPSYLNYGSINGQVWYGEDIFVGYRYYEKVKQDVLFPFGFGLSYTTFDFKDLSVAADDENVTVSVKVTNTGSVDGSETVQVYIEQSNPSVIRPVKELKEFGKVFLKAGETKSVEVKISIKEATSYWNGYFSKWESTKDTYKVLVGNSSDNIIVEGEFATSKTFYWLGL